MLTLVKDMLYQSLTLKYIKAVGYLQARHDKIMLAKHKEPFES